jgi:hypothetical protein
MRETTDVGPGPVEPSGEPAPDPVAARIAAVEPGLTRLVEQARRAWVQRATGPVAAGAQDVPAQLGGVTVPRWRPFEDAFPTFYQFTNKPR